MIESGLALVLGSCSRGSTGLSAAGPGAAHTCVPPGSCTFEDGCRRGLPDYCEGILGSFALRAEDSQLRRPQGGAVHFTHRADSAARFNPPLHSIVLDGVFDDSARPRFLELPRPGPGASREHSPPRSSTASGTT